jgi:hypothetical protein
MQTPLKIEPATGLLVGIRQVLSPFYDARPTGVLPELIVVHGISMPPGKFGGPWIDRLFTRPSMMWSSCVFPHTRWFDVTAKSSSTYHSANGHGTRVNRTTEAVPPATTSQSVSN